MILKDLIIVVYEPTFDVEYSVIINPIMDSMTMTISKMFQESVK
jgi:hypothetical protein